MGPLHPLPPEASAALECDNPCLLESLPTAGTPFYAWFDSQQQCQARSLLALAAQGGAARVVAALLVLPGAREAARLPSPTDLCTPLHDACASPGPGTHRIIASLIAAGADTQALNAAGQRPGDLLTQVQANPAPKETDGRRVSQLSKECYCTDEFRMYQFKIDMCPRLAEVHDWTDCPYGHPDEKARRRDPRRYCYQGVPCPDFRKGSCKRGDACSFSHGVFECWLHPTMYRTQLCKEGARCARAICFFAHSMEELREVARGTAAEARTPAAALEPEDEPWRALARVRQHACTPASVGHMIARSHSVSSTDSGASCGTPAWPGAANAAASWGAAGWGPAGPAPGSHGLHPHAVWPAGLCAQARVPVSPHGAHPPFPFQARPAAPGAPPGAAEPPTHCAAAAPAPCFLPSDLQFTDAVCQW
ncbi:Zinc finger CCCH domain-containing protein 33 [Auxenochlorella protothecoides]|uniref:Zinc finger CCCH domain-containing protein 33 n=2 Tax=Auxenochlorella protothecoides TaxID=3075 RepID=A0A087SKQ4_AUXPR|nr:Zinc finger CCCH domain-containing protein 33 [Auxenochlorella protothecoides]KFM26308.1 Zinc finger CCCH domain-containing protein 33 [Auxenochlorella protothecoides]